MKISILQDTENGMPVKTNIPFSVAEPGIEPEFKV